MINTKEIKKDSPIFADRPKPFVYLDSASTSQKPQTVINAVTHFYTHTNANIHRGIYGLAEEATEAYENAREKIATFIHANNSHEIVFTGNTNESINLVAHGWAKKFLKKGDIIVLSDMEHHANIIPWQRLKDEIGIVLHFLPLGAEYRLDYQSLLTSLRGTKQSDPSKIKLIALTHASNVLGTINPIKEIISFLRNNNIHAKILIDGAQSAPHMPVDMQDLGCDFFAFSGHKMLGPSGIGVLWAKEELLDMMNPLFVGSQMIASVTKEKAIWMESPWKFEVGTGKLEAVVGLSAAVEYLTKIGMENVYQHEQSITKYALEEFRNIENIAFYGPKDTQDRLGIFSFTIDGVHAHDIAQILDRSGICVRSGHHCAQPLMQILKVPATARASLYLYNDEKDIDALIAGIEDVKKTLKV